MGADLNFLWLEIWFQCEDHWTRICTLRRKISTREKIISEKDTVGQEENDNLKQNIITELVDKRALAFVFDGVLIGSTDDDQYDNS